MSADRAFGLRVIRLTATSVIALGSISFLWAKTLETPETVGIGLIGGWVLMPSILALSLKWPGLRVALTGPSALESFSRQLGGSKGRRPWIGLKRIPY